MSNIAIKQLPEKKYNGFVTRDTNYSPQTE